MRVPEGGDIELEIRLEEVTEGVLVTASVTAPLAGECARCLDDFTSSIQVRFQELFAAEAGVSGDDEYLLDGDLLDLEPALRDALVLDLPLSPLCAVDCPGLCSTCGMRLADAEPGHGHVDDGGVWAVLRDFFPATEAEASGADRRAEASGADRRAEASGAETHSSGIQVQEADADMESAEAEPVSNDRRQGRSSLAGKTGPTVSKEH